MRPEVALALLVGRGTRDESRSGLRKRDRIALEQSLAKDGSWPDQRFPLHMSELRELDPLMRLKVMIRRFIALSAHQPNLATYIATNTTPARSSFPWRRLRKRRRET